MDVINGNPKTCVEAQPLQYKDSNVQQMLQVNGWKGLFVPPPKNI